MNIFSPIKLLADWFTYTVFGLAPKTIFAEAINFFIYDSIKIFILLAIIIFIVSIIHSYLPPEKIRSIVARKNKYVGHVLASLLGIVTPFCTCSAIPLFLGFVKAGIPIGITFSFLVASPMINEVALVLLLGMFGIKVALIYIISGLTIAILSGIIIGKLKVENLLEPFVANPQCKCGDVENISRQSNKARLVYAYAYTSEVIRKIWLYVLIGIGLGAWIHGYVPADFLAKYIGSNQWYAIPLAVLIGIPMYSNAAGIIPLVSVLTAKGVSMGTALAFMMAVTALSLPEFIILKRIMKPKLIMIFASIVGVGIMLIGYLFNWIL